MTDTTAIGTLDAQRLELLRRKIAARGLDRQPAAAAADGHQVPEMSDGQRRMWFVQSVDPSSALLNICVSYRVTGNVDVARLHGRWTPSRCDTRCCAPLIRPTMTAFRVR